MVGGGGGAAKGGRKRAGAGGAGGAGGAAGRRRLALERGVGLEVAREVLLQRAYPLLRLGLLALLLGDPLPLLLHQPRLPRPPPRERVLRLELRLLVPKCLRWWWWWRWGPWRKGSGGRASGWKKAGADRGRGRRTTMSEEVGACCVWGDGGRGRGRGRGRGGGGGEGRAAGTGAGGEGGYLVVFSALGTLSDAATHGGHAGRR